MATAALPFLQEGASILGSLLGASHQQAVAAEANNLNQAVPNYRVNLTAIVSAFNSGQIDGPTALQAVDEAVNEYYSAVAGIIKDSSNHGTACNSADASGTGSNCNGPCTVGCAWIVPWSLKVKAAIQAGNATVMFGVIPSHSGFNGLPAWSLTTAHSFQSAITTSAALTPAPSAMLSSIVPNSISLNPSPNAILDSLTGSAGTASLRVNSPNIVPGTSLMKSTGNSSKLLLIILVIGAFFVALFALGDK